MPLRSEAKATSPVPPPTGVGPKVTVRVATGEPTGAAKVPVVARMVLVGATVKVAVGGTGVKVSVGSAVDVIVSVGIDVGVEVGVTLANGKMPRIFAGRRLGLKLAAPNKTPSKTSNSNHSQA